MEVELKKRLEAVMGKEQRYKPPVDFEENVKDPLVDFDMNDSTELWLIQWPKNQNPDYDGKELLLKLQGDGKLSTFEGTSGKEYDLVSSAIQESNATVFVSLASGTKIAGKISRRVSVVHYPEPCELQERRELQMAKSLKKSQISSTMSLTPSSKTTPSRSTRTTSTATPARSSFQRESSHLGNKRHASPGRSQSGVTSSGQGRSTTTNSGEGSSKKTKKTRNYDK